MTPDQAIAEIESSVQLLHRIPAKFHISYDSGKKTWTASIGYMAPGGSASGKTSSEAISNLVRALRNQVSVFAEQKRAELAKIDEFAAKIAAGRDSSVVQIAPKAAQNVDPTTGFAPGVFDEARGFGR